MKALHVFTLAFIAATSLGVPILSPDDQKLNSIVISEIDFTTEHPLVIVDAEISAEPEETFHELMERYDEVYMKTSNENQNVRKRNSQNEDVENVEEGGKSVIEKIQIEDPDVKKEFEIEISNAMQNQKIAEDEETTETAQIADTEYDPNYARKIPENSTKLTIHEKEHIQASLVEQLVHHNDHEHTTVLPDECFTHHELVINPEIVEVLEHINYESDSELKAHEHSTVINVANMDIDPIEIIPKDRHRVSQVDIESTTPLNFDDKGRSVNESNNENDRTKSSRSEMVEEKEKERSNVNGEIERSKVESATDNNDKFAGFAGIPVEDLEEPGHEVTEPDHYFIKSEKEEEPTVEDIVEAEAEVLRETLEFVAIYGKSLKFNDTVATTTESMDVTTTLPEVVSNVQITQVTDKIAINTSEVHSSEDEEDDEEEEEKEKESIENKSSEEVNDGIKLKRVIVDKSDESFEQNTINENADSQHVNLLSDETFKESTNHGVKKKDHPDGLAMPYDVMERKVGEEGRQIESIFTDFIDPKTQATLTAIFETFEDISTTISDGIKLTDELRSNVNSFRDSTDENPTVLDTVREAISAKNSKASLVVSDEMTIAENRLQLNSIQDSQISMMAIVSLIALISMIMLIGLFISLKRRAERFYIV